ncbi:hypothetical protein ACUM5Y_03930 [Marinomonas dokdonensis]|uniref:hypothetical protein n=1 Tax=Marinomonas dokdonensis TaxID=328224 RepID=UPI0040554480
MLSVNELAIKKREAIRYRLRGLSLAEIRGATGLSVPTIVKAYESFRLHGWNGVGYEVRGRKSSELRANCNQKLLKKILMNSSKTLFGFCRTDDLLRGYLKNNVQLSKKTLLRRLKKTFVEQNNRVLFEQLDQVLNESCPASGRKKVNIKCLVLGFYPQNEGCVFYVQDKRGERRFFWAEEQLSERTLIQQLDRLILSDYIGSQLAIVIKTDCLSRYLQLQSWRKQHEAECELFAQWDLNQKFNV